MKLTSREDEVLGFIQWCIEDCRRPPTYKEIREHIGVASDNSVYKILSKLEDKGFIVRDPRTARNIQLL